MRTYGQFCPVALASEALTERWSLLVIRELLAGSRRFNELRRGVPRMSPSLLSKRLTTLERLGVVDRIESTDGSRTEYLPTDAAQELRPIVELLGEWGVRWVRGPAIPDEHLDARLLMWDMQRRVAHDQLPEQRVVVHFDLDGSNDDTRHFWLVLNPTDVDLCVRDPGYRIDLDVTGHVRDLVRYWMGDTDIDDLIARRELDLSGPTHLVGSFADWFERNRFAHIAPANVGG